MPHCSHLRQRYCLQSLIYVRYDFLSWSLLVISLAIIFHHGYPCYVGRLPFEMVRVRYQYWLHACFCSLSAFWLIGGENFRPSFSDLPLVALIARIWSHVAKHTSRVSLRFFDSTTVAMSIHSLSSVAASCLCQYSSRTLLINMRIHCRPNHCHRHRSATFKK